MPTKVSIAPGLSEQSASTTTNTSGGEVDSHSMPKCSAYPLPRRSLSNLSITSAPAPAPTPEPEAPQAEDETPSA